MFQHERLNQLDDFFKPYLKREQKGAFFCRFTSYNQDINCFLTKLISQVKKSGVYIKGKIPNPDEHQLSFFREIVGLEFFMKKDFFIKTLKKWLPRLNSYQCTILAEALFNILSEMALAGKNINMLKNAYIKFMCWFYYKFERILIQLGKENPPKILYEGDISDYELKMFRILSKSGCDILLVQRSGDDNYRKLDPSSAWSQLISVSDSTRFPENFSLTDLDRQPRPSVNVSFPFHTGAQAVQKPVSKIMSTNTWISGDLFSDSLKDGKNRGSDPNLYYNIFARIRGAEQKDKYQNKLLRWKMSLESHDRKTLLLEKRIPMPSVAEVQKVKRGNFMNFHQLINQIFLNICYPKYPKLEEFVRNALAQLLNEEQESLQVIWNRAVCMICWLNRYLSQLFSQWQPDNYPIFIYYGTCQNSNEALFLRLMARIPLDVFIICPDLSRVCKLNDPLLFDRVYEHSMPIGDFPSGIEQTILQTAAYSAEQDLNTILYQDTGLYRNRQFQYASPVVIHTIYEEIEILWDQEARYRPNFEVLDDQVIVPVIFSKVSGVKDGDQAKYWELVGRLITEDTFVIPSLPFITAQTSNPIRQYVPSFFKNGKLQIAKIKAHPIYSYGFIREDMQDYLFTKLQQMIDSKIITGTLTKGAEYTIISTVLNLDKRLLRMIQKYDFTKQIPKLLMINTTESLGSLEDSILATFLSLLGFDVLLMVPTGYQSIERFLERPLFVEHQAGEYIYDMCVPDLARLSAASHKESLINKIFKKGR